MWHSVDGQGWWMLWGGIMMLLFWLGVILFVVWIVQTVTRRPHEEPRVGPRPSQPKEIARERYARGEITRDEYVQITRDLDST